jgi:hypothetical protein
LRSKRSGRALVGREPLTESGRGGEVRHVGVFENRPEILSNVAVRLGKGGRRLSFCYEDGVIPARQYLFR